MKTEFESFRAKDDAPGGFRDLAFPTTSSSASRLVLFQIEGSTFKRKLKRFFDKIKGDREHPALKTLPTPPTLHSHIRFVRLSREPSQTIGTCPKYSPRQFWRIWRISQCSRAISSSLTSPSPYPVLFSQFFPLSSLSFPNIVRVHQKSEKFQKRERRGKEKVQQNETKTTAPRIPAWSPTVVLTRRHTG